MWEKVFNLVVFCWSMVKTTQNQEYNIKLLNFVYIAKVLAQSNFKHIVM